MGKTAKSSSVTITVPSGKVVLSGDRKVVAEAVGLICHSHLMKWITDEMAKGRAFDDAKAQVVYELQKALEKMSEKLEAKRR